MGKRCRMNKRLRKKKCRGEYAEWGRQLIVLRGTEDNPDEFHDAFITAVEEAGCYCGGGLFSNKIDVIVELGRMADNPEDKFNQIIAWAESRPDVTEHKTGKLFDLYYGEYEELNEQATAHEQKGTACEQPDSEIVT